MAFLLTADGSALLLGDGSHLLIPVVVTYYAFRAGGLSYAFAT